MSCLLTLLACSPTSAQEGTAAPGPGDTPAWAEVLVVAPDAAVMRDPSARAAVERTGLPWRVVHRASGIELLLVPPGTYLRGAGPADLFERANERPAHRVTLTRPFYLGRHEVTNAQLRRFRPEHDSGSFHRAEELTLDEDDMPAVDVSWDDAAAFCEHFGLRLPTEAEWEYAARAGVASRYPWGETVEGGEGWGNVFDAATQAAIPSMDWAAFPWEDRWPVSAPVGTFRANAWGFHDMLGNAREWCADAYHEDAYAAWRDGVDDPVRLDGDLRVLRGGGWGNAPRGSGLPYRSGMERAERSDGNGFRVALTP